MPRQSELRFERFQFFTGDKPTKPRCKVICAGVQENGKLPTENEPKIGFSLQNVRTVNVEGLPGLFRYRFTKQQRLLPRWCSYNVQWLFSSQFLSRYIVHVLISSPHKDIWSVLTGKNVLLFLSAQWAIVMIIEEEEK
ncbi:hypothetical protein YC2023_086955 [Brassica napus]